MKVTAAVISSRNSVVAWLQRQYTEGPHRYWSLHEIRGGICGPVSSATIMADIHARIEAALHRGHIELRIEAGGLVPVRTYRYVPHVARSAYRSGQ